VYKGIIETNNSKMKVDTLEMADPTIHISSKNF
jgi:hypothetical protein